MAKYAVIYGCFKHGLKAAGPYPSLEQAIEAASRHIDPSPVSDVLELDESGVPPPPPSPKFRLGEKVWVMTDNRTVIQLEIDEIHQKKQGPNTFTTYTLNQLVRKEHEVFATKQGLLDSL